MPPLESLAQGIDVSKWQGDVDWPAVKAAGALYAFIKSTDGAAGIDPRFAQNWTGARAASVPRGAYHVFRPDEDPGRQAEHLARTLNFLPGELPPAIDVEVRGGVSNDARIASLEVCLLEVERLLGMRPIIYTAAWFYNPFMKGSNGQYPAYAPTYDLWVAHYTSATTPLLPRSWTQWTFWQHTDSGQIGGVAGNVDRDRFRGTPAELDDYLQQAMAGGAAPVVAAAETIPNVTNQAMINAFRDAFGDVYWDVILRCGLASMALPASNRPLPYAGPPLEQIPTLSNSEIMALFAALGLPAPVLDTGNAQAFLVWEHHALAGLHGPADPGGSWVPQAFDEVKAAKVKAVKVLAPDVQPAEIARLRADTPDIFLLARLFTGQLHEPRGDGTPAGAGRWLANEVTDNGAPNSPLRRAFDAGVRHFEVHNEPNLTLEGLGVNWQDGAQFAEFFNACANALRPLFPGAQFGFPGLSPGPAGGERLIDQWTFLDQAVDAVNSADFLCAHTYWGNLGVDLQQAVALLRQFCERYPGKLVFCTEFSNNQRLTPRETKMDEYAQFFQACRTLPTNLGASFIYALSWRNDNNFEGLLDLGADGQWRAQGLGVRLGSHLA